jgi:hypothetical protein
MTVAASSLPSPNGSRVAATRTRRRMRQPSTTMTTRAARAPAPAAEEQSTTQPAMSPTAIAEARPPRAAQARFRRERC